MSLARTRAGDHHSRVLLLAVALLLAMLAALTGTANGAHAGTPAPPPVRRGPPPADIRVAATVRVTLLPGTQRDIEIPVPEPLHGRDSIAFRVNRTMSSVVGGAGDGMFMRADAVVPISLSVPQALRHGRHRVADVRFWSADGEGEMIIVPIELVVPEPDDAAAVTERATRWLSAMAGTSERPPAAAPAVRMEPTVYLSATPRSVQLVSVPLPSTLAGGDSVVFAVSRTPGVAVGGAAEGVVHGESGRVLLSVSVPSQALAGPFRVGDVRFRARTRPDEVFIVPVALLVEPVRAISVVTSTPKVHAVQGRTTTVRVVVTNGGNAQDTVQLSLTVPDKWWGRLRDAQRVVLAPGATATRDIELTAPREEFVGTADLTVYAARLANDATAADANQRVLTLPVQVIPAAQGGAAFGPLLGVSYNAVQQPGQPVRDSWGMTLTGPLAAGVSVSASWTQSAMYGSPGVSRVGGGQLFPSVSLFHRRWQLNAGNAASDLGDLGGLLRNGQGVSASYADTVWNVRTLLVRPFSFELASGTGAASARYAGVLAGARVERVRDGLAWSSTLSHLRDPLVTRAQLDALVVGVERVAGDATTARGELAYRRWDSGRGVGAAAEFGQRSTGGDWRLRATHAPGGSQAFARSQTDVTLTGARRIGGMRLGYLGFHAGDEGIGGVRQETRGVGVLPQWQIGRGGSVGLEARLGRSSSGDRDMRLRTMSQILGLFGSSRIGPLTATSAATVQRTSRDVAFDAVDAARLDESQLNWTAQFLWPFAFGTLDAYTSLQRRLGANALSAGQHDLMLRADKLAIPLLDNRVYMNAAVGRTVSLGTGAQVFTQRIGFSAVLPLGTYARVDFERNPFRGSFGARGWTTALRIERSFGTPGFLRAGRGLGVVFEDRNGNGQRDPDEPGLPGVLVQVGGEVVVTDRGGAYQLTRTGGGLPVVDERSLPFGLMVAPQVTRAALAGARDGATDIPVVPVGVVEVRLELVNDAALGLSPLSLAGVTVMAIDADGRRHFATRLPDNRALFEALPPGEYRLEVDASGAAEPLTLQGASPVFRLDGRTPQQVVRAVLGPRRVRMFRAAPVQRSGTP